MIEERDMIKHLFLLLPLWAQLQSKLEDRSRGQGFVEYAFIILFVGVAITVALVAFQGGLESLFSTVTSCLGTDGQTEC
jgi:Flp pilus assembly pilin Flp